MNKLVFALILIWGQAALAGETCETRLTTSIAKVTLKSLNEGKIGLDDVKAMIDSQVPFDPTSRQTPLSRNSALMKYYKTALTTEYWESVRAELKLIYDQESGKIAVASDAREETRVLPGVSVYESFQLPQTAEPGDWLSTPDGRNFYWYAYAGSLYVRQLKREKEILQVDAPLDAKPVLQMNDSGHPALYVSKQSEGRGWRSMLGLRSYEVVEYDLDNRGVKRVSGPTSQTRAEQEVAQIAQRSVREEKIWVDYLQDVSAVNISHPLIGQRSFIYNFDVVLGTRLFEVSGRLFVSVICRLPDSFKTTVIIYEPAEEKIVFEKFYPDEPGRPKTFMFSKQGEIYLAVDRAIKVTELYAPLRSDRAFYSADLSRFKADHFTFLRGPNEKFLIAGQRGKTVTVFSLFAEDQ